MMETTKKLFFDYNKENFDPIKIDESISYEQ